MGLRPLVCLAKSGITQQSLKNRVYAAPLQKTNAGIGEQRSRNAPASKTELTQAFSFRLSLFVPRSARGEGVFPRRRTVEQPKGGARRTVGPSPSACIQRQCVLVTRTVNGILDTAKITVIAECTALLPPATEHSLLRHKFTNRAVPSSSLGTQSEFA